MYRENAYDKRRLFEEALTAIRAGLCDLSPYVSSMRGGQGMERLDALTRRVDLYLESLPREPATDELVAAAKLEADRQRALADGLDVKLAQCRIDLGLARNLYNLAVRRLVHHRFSLFGAAAVGWLVGMLVAAAIMGGG